jgi:hypothetical protein
LAADERIWVSGGDDAAGYACGDEGIGAGAGAALVGAGFKGHVSSRAEDVVAECSGLLERCDLGMVARVVQMCALAEDDVVARQDAAYGWIRACERGSFTREGERSGEMELALGCEVHAGLE